MEEEIMREDEDFVQDGYGNVEDTAHSDNVPSAKKEVKHMEDGNKVMSWVTSIMELISNYGFKKLFQALGFIIIVVMSFIVIRAITEQEIVDKMLAEKITIHNEGTEIRTRINPEVNNLLTRMIYEMDCDRAIALEMHNGKENPTGLPFLYCDANYEETRDRTPYVGDEYINLNMSKYSFPTYLYEHTYYIGSVEDLYAIDKKLAMRLEANETKYIAVILMRTTVDIGFLMISYVEPPTHTRQEILSKLTYYVQEIGVYLDYNIQIDKKKK